MTTNDITGDRLRSKPNTKAFDDNFDRIFRKGDNGQKPIGASNESSINVDKISEIDSRGDGTA
jgi:hypothetical protein